MLTAAAVTPFSLPESVFGDFAGPQGHGASPNIATAGAGAVVAVAGVVVAAPPLVAVAEPGVVAAGLVVVAAALGGVVAAEDGSVALRSLPHADATRASAVKAAAKRNGLCRIKNPPISDWSPPP